MRYKALMRFAVISIVACAILFSILWPLSSWPAVSAQEVPRFRLISRSDTGGGIGFVDVVEDSVTGVCTALAWHRNGSYAAMGAVPCR